MSYFKAKMHQIRLRLGLRMNNFYNVHDEATLKVESFFCEKSRDGDVRWVNRRGR